MLFRSRLGSWWSLLLLLARASSALAAEPARATREYRVEFAADRVEVDGELGFLELDGNVRVQAQRYLLKSEHLKLRRGPRGVEADGRADVAFCTCDDPPVRLRVSHATLAPPTDALFNNARLELWTVPVLWLPVLWLRAPTRPGLTFPRLAYRGEDGFFAGAGGYLPLSSADGRVTSSLTLAAGGYLNGARVEAELDTELSSSRVAWDHVHQSAVEVDAHGSAAYSEATFAYRVDALRGARAPRQTSSLEVAARRTDRARVSVSHVDQLALGFGLRADAPRGGAWRDLGSVGPELYLGAARALGSSVSYDAFGVARSLRLDENRSQSTLLERGTISARLRPGAFGLDLTAAQASELQVSEGLSQGRLRGGLSARVGVPLARPFGSLVHFIEPLLVVRGLTEAVGRDSHFGANGVLASAAGFDTALGERVSRQALSLNLRAGAIVQQQTTSLVGSTRITVDARAIGLAQTVALLGNSDSFVSLSRVRLGTREGLHWLLRADGATRGSPAATRVLFDESWFDPTRAFLDWDNWSAGSEIAVPWSRALSTTASLDYDLTTKELLAAWGGVGYRHPCGCLAVASFVGHRVGRGGFDAWVGFDLAP